MSAATTTPHTNPFPGLRPFHEDEVHLFFGRESQVDAMVDKLAATRFLAVVGTSGSGKSSLVNCGLRPALHGGLMARAGTAWRMAQFRPGSDPLREMARALAKDGVLFRDYQAGGLSLADIVDTTLRMSKLGLIDIVEQARLGEGVNLLVVVDQFEELFRYRRLGAGGDEKDSDISEQATAFVNLLLEAGNQTKHPIYIVLTMRSDFLGDCAQFPGLAEAINAGQYLVPRMTRDERRAAINGPVSVGGAKISPVLLTRLVNDVGDNPDQLSILQHALNRTWAYWENEGSGNGPLDLTHYEAIGSMAHALDQHAEKAYAELGTERQQQICEKLFKALTDKATDSRGVRRPTTLGTLCALADATEPEVTEVIDVFRKPSRSFLMPPAGDALEAHTVIDISHESLMRVWQRLITWADEEAQSAQGYRRLAEAAVLHGEGKAGLWRDPDLQLARNWRDQGQPNETWAHRYHPGFAAAMDFLTQSSEARDAERAEQEAQRRRELQLAKELANAQEKKASTFRRMLIAGGLLFAIAVYEMIEVESQRAETEAAVFMAGLSGSQRPTTTDYDTLQLLADSRGTIRFAFMERLLKSPKAIRLRALYPYLLHASIGLNVQDKNRIKELLLKYGNLSNKNEAIDRTVAELGVLLAGDDSAFYKMVVTNFVTAMEQTSDPDALAYLGDALGGLGKNLSEHQAAAGAAAIVTAMEQTSNPDALDRLGKALGSLGENLPEHQAAAIAQTIVTAMEQTSNPDALDRLGKALGSLGKNLSEHQAAAAAGAAAIVTAMEQTSNPDALDRLGVALGSLGKNLPEHQAAAGAAAIVTAMEQTSNPYALDRLGKALGGLGKNLPEHQAAAGAAAILTAMEQMSNPDALAYLGVALGSLGENLPEHQAAAGAAAIVTAMEQTSDPDALDRLGDALGGLGKNLSEHQAAAIAQTILTAMKQTSDPYALAYLGDALGGLGKNLPEHQAAAGAAAIMTAMEQTSNPDALAYLGVALGGLGKNLSEHQAAAGAATIVTAMEQTSDPDALAYLGDALGGLGKNLSEHQAAAGAAAIVTAMEQTSDPEALVWLGVALGSLGKNLSEHQAAAIAQTILTAMEQTSDPDALAWLGKALGGLGKNLSEHQAAAIAQTILTAMEQTSDPDALAYLGVALGGLGKNLSEHQAAAGAAAIVTAMEKTSDPDAWAYLGDALGGLGKNLSEHQAAAIAQTILTAMEKTSDPEALVWLGVALGGLGENLPENQAAAGAAAIVTAMEKMSDPDAFAYLGVALGGLGENLPEHQAAAGAAAIVTAMKKTSDPDALDRLGKALGALSVRMDARTTYTTVLKSIVCVGDTRKKVLAGLQKKTEERFDGNLWNAVKWLNENKGSVKVRKEGA